MFKAKTVFIVGAGASVEMGFPTSATLRNSIVQMVNFRFEVTSMIKGDHAIYAALKEHARETLGTHDANPLFHAGQAIARGLSQAASIDNFIENHRGDDKIELVAKIAIVKTILEHERKSKIFYDGNREFSDLFRLTSETWLHVLFEILTERVSKNELHSVFENIVFICFNYDRCIEHYLCLGLQNLYGIDREQSAKLLENVTVLHPYGTVGALPWQKRESSVEFGGDSGGRLRHLAHNIRTFSESVEEERTNVIRDAITAARRIVFLGSAFHDQNMDLLSLSPRQDFEAKEVLGSSYGISHADCAVIERTIRNGMRLGADGRVTLEGQKCYEFMNAFRRTISAG